MSPYTLSEKQQEVVASVLEPEREKALVREIFKSLDGFIQEHVDNWTNYLTDEYQLVFEDLVKERSKQLVQALLRGDERVAQSFGLITHINPLNGEEFSYDRDGIRKAVFDTFADRITHAEVFDLREQVTRLTEQLRWERER